MTTSEIKEINGAWYHNGINLYASSREDAERRVAEMRPMPTAALKTGSLAGYTSGSYDRAQGQASIRRGSKRAR